MKLTVLLYQVFASEVFRANVLTFFRHSPDTTVNTYLSIFTAWYRTRDSRSRYNRVLIMIQQGFHIVSVRKLRRQLAFLNTLLSGYQYFTS